MNGVDVLENEIIKKILDRSKDKDLLEVLTKTLSYTELNTLLLEVYKIRCGEIRPADLMENYEKNKYVKPAFEDPIKLRKLEIGLFKIAKTFSFTPVELSPVVPLGTCSCVGPVNQNNILSSIRGTEVLSDSTNSLALYICGLKKKTNKDKPSGDDDLLKYCTVIRHIRAQKILNPRFTPHFLPYCMVSSGRDKGSFSFEKDNMLEHINFYKAVLKDLAHIETFKLKLFKTGADETSERLYAVLSDHIRKNMDTGINIAEDMGRVDNNYYRGIQFKIYIDIDGTEAEAADGGFVDWSQKLLENRKERMMISAIGTAPLLCLG
jgi:hypothetical protein